MKKKISAALPFLIMPILIPVYRILDSLILVNIFGCGCVPSTQTNTLNIPFNANDLRMAVFLVMTIGLFIWSLAASKAFQKKAAKLLYGFLVLLWNVTLTVWTVKTFMWE